MVVFEIQPINPENYRQQTRRSTLMVIATFAVLAMGLASLGVALLGEAGGDNLRLNIAGVVAGLLITIGLVRCLYWKQAWMSCAVYGWRLKRSLMSITNVMHHVTAGVQAGDPDAMKLLRFYHLGLTQMHMLDGNSASLGEVSGDIERHLELMQAQRLETDQNQLHDDWLGAVKRFPAAR